jgi:hypothetical protein
MTHLQKAPCKPLFLNEKQGNTFVALFDDEIEQRIAKCIFIDGLTNEETALYVGYCTRQIERIRKNMLEVALKMLVEIRTPKKPLNPCGRYFGEAKGGNCPCCGAHTNSATYTYCRKCGQALDWGDSE